MKLSSFFVLSLFVFLTGCASVQNLTVMDVQQEKYFYKQYEFNKSLDQIESAIYEYSTVCRSLGNFMRNPIEKNTAKMTVEGMGLTTSSVLVVLDFEEKSSNETILKAYTYYSGWQSYVDKVIKAVNSPQNCE